MADPTQDEELVQQGPEAEMIAAEEAQEAAGDAGTDERLAAMQEQVLRVQAEMQNLRRRAEADVEKAHKFALEKFVREILPVIDSLEKTLEGVGEDVPPVFRQGVEMTLGMLTGGVSKFGVEAVSPVGQTFDPQQHEAMSMVEVPNAPANSVLAVVQKGYLLNGRLVRPAMVVVARGAAPRVDAQV